MNPSPSAALRILAADERFAEMGAHSQPDGSDYLSGGYQCPDGPPGVSFSWRDIAERTTFGANISAAELEALEGPIRAALGGPPPKHDWRVAVDFRCPRCDRAVVVIFRSVDEDGKGWWTYEPTIVFELDPLT